MSDHEFDHSGDGEDFNCRWSTNAQWESARPNLDLPKIEARSEVSA